MCQYWSSSFPCGCFTWRNSGYSLCANRGEEGSCTISLRRYLWKTFCPRARKGFRGKQYTSWLRLPACYNNLDSKTVEELCCKCDSSPTNSSEGPTVWACAAHLELVSDEVVSLEVAEEHFEYAVALWPPDHRARYFRRKGDKACCKGMWWSY